MPVPVMLRSAISWTRKRQRPRGTYSGGGRTWHFVHCWPMSSSMAASSFASRGAAGTGGLRRVRAREEEPRGDEHGR